MREEMDCPFKYKQLVYPTTIDSEGNHHVNYSRTVESGIVMCRFAVQGEDATCKTKKKCPYLIFSEINAVKIRE